MINFYYEHAVLSPTHSIIVDSILLRLLRPLVTLGALVVGSVVSPLRLLLCHLGPLVARAKSAESSTESSAVSSAESLLRLLLCHLGPLVALAKSAESSTESSAEASAVSLLRLLRPLTTSSSVVVSPSLSPASLRF